MSLTSLFSIFVTHTYVHLVLLAVIVAGALLTGPMVRRWQGRTPMQKYLGGAAVVLVVPLAIEVAQHGFDWNTLIGPALFVVVILLGIPWPKGD